MSKEFNFKYTRFPITPSPPDVTDDATAESEATLEQLDMDNM